MLDSEDSSPSIPNSRPRLAGLHLCRHSDELRKAIRQNLHYGADWIKIVIDDQRYLYSVDDIRFVIAEAAAAGVRVAAHSYTEQGARYAIEAGVASIEYGFEMSDETLSRARDEGVMLVGTDLAEPIMKAWEGFDDDPDVDLYAQVIDRLRRPTRSAFRWPSAPIFT